MASTRIKKLIHDITDEKRLMETSLLKSQFQNGKVYNNYFIQWVVMTQATHSRFCCGVLCPRQEEVKTMCSKLRLMCNVCNYIVKGSSEEPS